MPVRHIPCGAFVNKSEETAFEKVNAFLNSRNISGQVILYTNLAHSYDVTRHADDIDQVVVAPDGLFVVEVKHWDKAYLKNNPDIVAREADKLDRKVAKIASKVKAKFPAFGHLKGRFLLTATNQGFGERRPLYSQCRFFALSELGQLLTRDKGEDSLSPRAIEDIALLLEPQAIVALNGDIRRLASIVDMNRLSPKEETFHRVYNGMSAITRQKLLVHLYDLSAFSTKDLRQAEEAARREFLVVHKLQAHSWLPRFMDSFQPLPGYPGELWFYSFVDPLAPSLAKRLLDRTWAWQDRIAFARNTIKAVKEMHEAGGDDTPFLHRNLSTATILVRNDRDPVLTGLEYARVPDQQTMGLGSPLVGDNFAPEVRSGGRNAANARSDCYSLCYSLLQLVPTEPTPEQGEFQSLLTEGLAASFQDRPTLATLFDYVTALAGVQDTTSDAVPARTIPRPDDWDEGLVIPFKGEHYRVVCTLGEGGFGKTFRVLHVAADAKESDDGFGHYVAKAAHEPRDAAPLLLAYRRVRPYTANAGNLLSTVFDIAPEDDPNGILAVLKWVEGEPLDNLTEYFSLYADDQGAESAELLATSWLKDLCTALGTLHQGGLIHGDVSPRNILYHRGDVTLTDYDLVLKFGEERMSCGTPPYAPAEASEEGSVADPSQDVFQLAASFFHVVFARLPFVHTGDGIFSPQLGLRWDGLDRDAMPIFAAFVDRATHPEPSRRFRDADEARAFLLATEPRVINAPPNTPMPSVVAVREPHSIPWLTNILTLYPGSKYGNIETKGLDSPFALGTYVETDLESYLIQQIRDSTASLVILCGNAGDGKTALLQHLLTQLGLVPPQAGQQVFRAQLATGKSLYVNFDGSSAFQGRSADELLNEFFEPFHPCIHRPDVIRLIAINDGRLLEWLEHYDVASGPTELTKVLRGALDSQTPPPFIQYRNLNSRSLVGGIKAGSETLSSDFLDKLLTQLLGGARTEEIWSPCKSCTAESYCPVNKMVNDLVGPKQGRQIRDRLYAALRAVHLQGRHHVTMRELRATLAYILFGLDACEDIHTATTEMDGFYDRAFSVASRRRQGKVLESLQRLDPALESHPRVDSVLLREVSGNESAENGLGRPGPDERRGKLASARRKAYFEWTEEQIATTRQSDRSGESVTPEIQALGLTGCEWMAEFVGVSQLSNEGKRALCRRLCLGLARMESLPADALARMDADRAAVPLKVTPKTPTETTFWVEKPLEGFDLEIEAFPSSMGIETLPKELVLVYAYRAGGHERLYMSLDLFSLLLDMAAGRQLVDAGSDDSFANLALFKRRLAQEDATTLFAWHPTRSNALYTLGIRANDESAESVQQIFLKAIESSADTHV